MTEPTSTLTFDHLILAVANKLGVAYFGATGTSVAAIPVNAQDLDLCKGLVNNAIRMFIADGPQPNGWRWLRPVLRTTVWGDIATNTSNKVSSATYNVAGSNTTLVVPTAAFYPTMELKTMTVTGVGDLTITDYLSATSVNVSGSNVAALNKTWSITADGNYTLPVSFSGQYLGGIAYAAATNLGVGADWTDESEIREWRSVSDRDTGTPFKFAVQVKDTGTPRRRWDLLAYPKPDSVLSIEFPAMLGFDSLVNGTEVPPSPFGHDEAVKAACLAQVEKEVEHILGIETDYYRKIALPNSYRIDAMSAPKKLGYFWNRSSSTNGVRPFHGPRQTVTFNP